jgi:hypothetical protein
MPNEFRVKRGLIVEGSGSNVVIVDGVSGRLFAVNDSFSGSLFSVNTIAGLPVIEAFSDNTVRIGQFGSQVLFVSQSRVGFGKESALGATVEVSGSMIVTGSLSATRFTGSLFGTASWANSSSWAPPGAAPTTVTFTRVTGSYTFALADAGRTLEVSGSPTAPSYSLTIPASSSVDFADGTFIDVVLYGTGSILFVTASGVIIRSANNWNRIGTRFGAATLINISGNEWYLIGNINP